MATLATTWHALPRWVHLLLLAKVAHGTLPAHLATVVRVAVYGTTPRRHPHRTSIAPARPLAVLPPYHSTVYSACAEPQSHIVLLHGWGMSSKDWATTAKKLAADHAVLTLDFYGHGASPYLPLNDMHDPNVLVHQVRDAIERAGWATAQVTIAGISMGSAIALRYSQRHPDSVRRLILLCGAGMAVSRWYALTETMSRWNNALLLRIHELNATSPFWHMVFHRVSVLRAIISHSYLTRLTPEYGVNQTLLQAETLAKVHACIWPMVDVLHPLQLELFEDAPQHIQIVPGVDHALFCLLINDLALHAKPELWL